jgi:hypothetical protein
MSTALDPDDIMREARAKASHQRLPGAGTPMLNWRGWESKLGRAGVTDRERLPNRRVSELVDFEHGGRRWTLTVGRFADGRVGEVFLDTPKASAIGEIAADAAIAASVAFQHGAPLETVRHALADRRAGPLGAALALIDAYQAQHKDSQQTGADR